MNWWITIERIAEEASTHPSLQKGGGDGPRPAPGGLTGWQDITEPGSVIMEVVSGVSHWVLTQTGCVFVEVYPSFKVTAVQCGGPPTDCVLGLEDFFVVLCMVDFCLHHLLFSFVFTGAPPLTLRAPSVNIQPLPYPDHHRWENACNNSKAMAVWHYSKWPQQRLLLVIEDWVKQRTLWQCYATSESCRL